MVPNIYQGLGNSPVALQGVLQTDGLLKKGQLGAAEIEAVKLAVSGDYGCDYCLAPHTLLGKKVIAQTVFTNLFNRVHRTPLDFPAAPALQSETGALQA